MSAFATNEALLKQFEQRWMTEFKSKNHAALFALFANDVVFCSPVVERAYTRKADLELILGFVIHVLEELTYTRILFDIPKRTACFVFKAFITTHTGERVACDGIDLFELNEAGVCSHFSVFVRPLRATLALSASMKPKLEAAKRAATASKL